VDLVAVTAKPGISPDVLAGRIRAALDGGQGYTIATGAARGDVANLSAAVERSNGQALGGALIAPIVLISLFVLASTTALAVNLRRRRFALLRAVGATRGQVRRAILAELAVCGVAGGALGWLPGTALGAVGVRALAAHQMLPAGSAAWLSPWLLAIACGASALVAWLSGQVAARRGSRTPPAQALRETAAERKWPNPVRVVLGLAAAGGAGTLMAFTFGQKSSAGQLAHRVSGAAYLHGGGSAARPAARGARCLAGQAGGRGWRGTGPARSGRDRRTAAPRRLGGHPGRDGGRHGRHRLLRRHIHTARHRHPSGEHADGRPRAVGSRPLRGHPAAGAGHDRGPCRGRGNAGQRGRHRPGALEQVYGEAVTGGPLGQLLDLGVTSGSPAAPRPGQIAVSTLEAGQGVLGVHTGSNVTVYLPDGTPYRATVSAIYNRSLASGDLLIPASVAAGHTGTPARYSQILVSGGTQAELARLAAGHPGLRVTSRAAANAQSAQAAAQNSFANNLILGILAALSAVALVNTLVVTTVERRRVLRLLGRVGATRGQLGAMFGWHVVFVASTGLVAGAAAGAVTLFTVTRAITGAWTPFIPLVPGVALVGVVAALTAGAVLIPFRLMSRREPTLAAG